MAFIDQLKSTFRKGSTLAQLIYINVAVFLVLKIVYVFFYLFQIPGIDKIYTLFSIPADFSTIIKQPWSVITYMFLHEGFGHIFGNMIVLFFMGRLFLNYLDGKKLLSTYLIGGLIGGLFFVLAFNIFPSFRQVVGGASALGASASVMAVMIAITVIRPNQDVYLYFLFRVKLKYISIGFIVLDLVSIPRGNPGGHIAHLGGALYGYLFAAQLVKGKDISTGFGKFMDALASVFKPRKKIKVTYKKPVDDYTYNAQKAANQEEVDRILDKIAKSGYDSLSKKEKEILFQAGKK